MLDAWGDHPVVAQTIREASDALGEDIGKLIHEGPKEALALTTNTQPVMLVAGVAVSSKTVFSKIDFWRLSRFRWQLL